MDDSSKAAKDGELIARARSDPEAFTLLYRAHYDAIFRYCVHRLFERAAAEDVTSEVFLKAVGKFESFAGDERQFRNWLYRIATNAVNYHLRKTARQYGLLEEACERANSSDSDSTASSERMALLREAMLDLKPHYQTIITLRFFEDLKLAEIAEVVGSSSGTIRSQMSRALAKLRQRCVSAKQEM